MQRESSPGSRMGAGACAARTLRCGKDRARVRPMLLNTSNRWECFGVFGAFQNPSKQRVTTRPCRSCEHLDLLHVLLLLLHVLLLHGDRHRHLGLAILSEIQRSKQKNNANRATTNLPARGPDLVLVYVAEVHLLQSAKHAKMKMSEKCG